MNLIHIYNMIGNMTIAQIKADTRIKAIVTSYNYAGISDLADAGWTGDIIPEAGKYRLSDPATPTHPSGQVNLPDDTPADTAAHYLHNNIAPHGEVITVRDDNRAANFLHYPTGHPQAGKIIRNSNMAIGSLTSSTLQALYDAYYAKITADEPAVNWHSMFNDDENVDHLNIFGLGSFPTAEYADPASNQYFTDTLAWAIFRRNSNHAQGWRHITNVQGSNLTRYNTLADALIDDATLPVVMMNEFFGTQTGNATSWKGYTIVKSYMDKTAYVSSKSQGYVWNVLHCDAHQAFIDPSGTIGKLFSGLVAAHYLSISSESKGAIKPGSDYSNMYIPEILNQVDVLGNPQEDAQWSGHVASRKFDGGTITLNLDTGVSTFDFTPNGEVVPPEPPVVGDITVTPPVVTEAVDARITEALGAEIDRLNAFLAEEDTQTKLVLHKEVVYMPETYNDDWLLLQPSLITALYLAGFFAFPVDKQGIAIKLTSW